MDYPTAYRLLNEATMEYDPDCVVPVYGADYYYVGSVPHYDNGNQYLAAPADGGQPIRVVDRYLDDSDNNGLLVVQGLDAEKVLHLYIRMGMNFDISTRGETVIATLQYREVHYSRTGMNTRASTTNTYKTTRDAALAFITRDYRG